MKHTINDNISYNWIDTLGVAECIIEYKNKQFIGQAYCHPDDKDMQSEKVGYEIANRRAVIQLLEYTRDCEIIPSLRALNQLYYSMKHSQKFNPKAYESKMLYRQIRNWEEDLDTIKEMIATEKQQLIHYIAIKDNMYKIVRKHKIEDAHEAEEKAKGQD